MKKITAIMLSLMVVFVFSACGGNDENSNKVTLGDYNLEIKGTEISKDSDGDTAVVISYNFTNNSDKAASFLWSISEKMKQGNKELESCTVFLSKDSLKTMLDSATAEIKPGETKEVKSSYKLKDKTTPISAEYSLLFGNKKVNRTIEIAK